MNNKIQIFQGVAGMILVNKPHVITLSLENNLCVKVYVSAMIFRKNKEPNPSHCADHFLSGKRYIVSYTLMNHFSAPLDVASAPPG
jgi:hypothetical protein